MSLGWMVPRRPHHPEGRGGTTGAEAGDATYHGCEYDAEQCRWLAAIDAWKVRRGPVVRAAELLVILADLGYRREGGMAAGELDQALEHERRRRALGCGRRGRFLTACEVLSLLRELGWAKG